MAQALYLADGYLAFPGGKTDLMGLFNSIRAAGYPHVQKQSGGSPRDNSCSMNGRQA